MKVTTVLIDINGTIITDDGPIEGSVRALSKLRIKHPDISIRFVSNSSKETDAEVHERLTGCGFKIDRTEIFSSLTATRYILQKSNLRPLLLIPDSAKAVFKDIKQDDPNAVVIGAAPHCFNYDRLNEALQILKRGEDTAGTLIGIHSDMCYESTVGYSLGPGPFIKALEYGAQKQALIVGKPSRGFFHFALGTFKKPTSDSGEDKSSAVTKSEPIDPATCIMIGDDLHTDIFGAQEAGMLGILVRTGVYREGDETKNPEGTTGRPWCTVGNFEHAVEIVEETINERPVKEEEQVQEAKPTTQNGDNTFQEGEPPAQNGDDQKAEVEVELEPEGKEKAKNPETDVFPIRQNGSDPPKTEEKLTTDEKESKNEPVSNNENNNEDSTPEIARFSQQKTTTAKTSTTAKTNRRQKFIEGGVVSNGGEVMVKYACPKIDPKLLKSKLTE